MGSWFSRENEEEKEDVKVNLEKTETGDQVATKHFVDDHVKKYFDEKKYDINYTWDNYRLLAMLTACIVAACAHFIKLSPPFDVYFAYSCVGVFALLNSGLALFMKFIEKDILLTIKPKKKSKVAYFYVRTKFERFDDTYKVALEYATEDQSLRARVDEDVYIGKMFDEEGYFDEASLFKALDRIVSRFEAQKLKKDK